jgi:Na+-driven multidrug efflux pump
MGHIDLHRRFLNSLGKNYVPMACLAIGVFSHQYSSKYFVIDLDMGIQGTGMALVLTNTIIFSLQLFYSSFMMPEIQESVFCIDSRSLNWGGVKSYMKIGGPAIMMSCLDWWVFELMIVISASFGVTG